MKVGSLVECVNDKPLSYTVPGPMPVVGNIYTVSDIFKTPMKGLIFIRVDEIELDVKDRPYIGFDISRFREVQPPMSISIEDFLMEPQNA